MQDADLPSPGPNTTADGLALPIASKSLFASACAELAGAASEAVGSAGITISSGENDLMGMVASGAQRTQARSAPVRNADIAA
jgi:hypothetical protein